MEISLEDAIREIVQTTHTMFAVDGAGHSGASSPRFAPTP
jgi:hypothetical protein